MKYYFYNYDNLLIVLHHGDVDVQQTRKSHCAVDGHNGLVVIIILLMRSTDNCSSQLIHNHEL